MAKALGRMIATTGMDKTIAGINPAPHYTPTTHHQFFDDIIFIKKAEMEESLTFKKILNIYEKATHQKTISKNPNFIC